MRFLSGVIDQVGHFIAVDSTDLKTRETGLTTFTVYRSRNGGAATLMTTPTVVELSAANMPGVYTLLFDEDMSLTAGNDSEAMVFHITQAAMAPVTLEIEIYRGKITAGNTLGVAATGDISGNVDGNVDGSVASVTAAIVLPSIPANWLTAAGINAGAFTAAKFAANWLEAGGIVAGALNGKGNWNIGKTGYALTLADWNVGKSGYALTLADWNVGKTGYALTVADWNVGKTGYSISGTKTTLDALVDLSAADVNAQVLDVMNVDTFAELAQAAPPASPTMREMMQHSFQWYMHKWDGNNTLVQYYKADGTTIMQKRTVAEAGGLLTEQKIVSGV